MRFREFVPEDKQYWYYHEPSNVLLHNNQEYGWVAVAHFEQVEKEFEEMKEAIEQVQENGVICAGDIEQRTIDYMGDSCDS